jgi:hypothetical protein
MMTTNSDEYRDLEEFSQSFEMGDGEHKKAMHTLRQYFKCPQRYPNSTAVYDSLPNQYAYVARFFTMYALTARDSVLKNRKVKWLNNRASSQGGKLIVDILGSGPCPEIWGVCAAIAESDYPRKVTAVNFRLFDANAVAWMHVADQVVELARRSFGLKVTIENSNVDFSSEAFFTRLNSVKSDLVITQNAVNELQPEAYELLKVSLMEKAKSDHTWGLIVTDIKTKHREVGKNRVLELTQLSGKPRCAHLLIARRPDEQAIALQGGERISTRYNPSYSSGLFTLRASLQGDNHVAV